MVSVLLKRDVDEEEAATLPPVNAPRYPNRKDEGWWLVVGDTKNNRLLSIKRVVIPVQLSVKLDFEAPEDSGKYSYTLYLMCDSYTGCDQELQVDISVQPPRDSDSE